VDHEWLSNLWLYKLYAGAGYLAVNIVFALIVAGRFDNFNSFYLPALVGPAAGCLAGRVAVLGNFRRPASSGRAYPGNIIMLLAFGFYRHLLL